MLYGLDYEERIKALGISKLSDRRVKGNLIQMYVVLNNLEEINWYKCPILATNPHEKRSISSNQQSLVREHLPSKLRNDFSHFIVIRHEFYTNQVTERWNKLPNSVVKASSLNSFKSRLDSYQDSGCYSSSEHR